jgi:hypothetical protein
MRVVSDEIIESNRFSSPRAAAAHTFGRARRLIITILFIET